MNVVVCVKQIPDPAVPGELERRPHARARGQADPRRVRQLRRRDGAAARRHGRRRRGHARLDGAEQRGVGPAHRARDGRGQGDPRLRRRARRASDALVDREGARQGVERAGDIDLVLTATESTDGYTGTMPAQVAELLGWPSLTFAKHVEIADGKVEDPAPDRSRLRRRRGVAARGRERDRRCGRAALPVVQGDHGGEEQAGRRGDGGRPRSRRRRRSAGPARARRSRTSTQAPAREAGEKIEDDGTGAREGRRVPRAAEGGLSDGTRRRSGCSPRPRATSRPRARSSCSRRRASSATRSKPSTWAPNADAIARRARRARRDEGVRRSTPATRCRVRSAAAALAQLVEAEPARPRSCSRRRYDGRDAIAACR